MIGENEYVSDLQNVNFLAKELLCDFILQNTPIAFYWCNRDGIMLGCNELELKILGIASEKEYIGKHATETGCTPKAWENYKKVMESGVPQVFEEEYKPSFHEKYYFLSTKTPIKSPNGKVIGMLGASIDITNRKKIEGLQIEKKAALKSLEMIELLSASIAFEMRSAMAVIGINADLLRLAIEAVDRDLNSDEEHKNIKTMHDHIKYAIHNGETIVNMLLTKVNNVIAGKIDSKNFELQSVRNVITSSIDEYPFLEKEKKLVHWDPKTNKDFKYFGREGLTKNVLFILIKNALRAIKEYDKGEIFITLASDEKFNYLIFKDTGMGIPESHMANLFQQFNTHTSGGSGLGLAFCKMIMTSYGGDITCKSKDREFTEFTLSFPKEGGTATTLKQKITARQAK